MRGRSATYERVLAEFGQYDGGRRRLVGIAIGTPYDLEHEQRAFEIETEKLLASFIRKRRSKTWTLPKYLRTMVRNQARRWFQAFRLYIHARVDETWARKRSLSKRWCAEHHERAKELQRLWVRANKEKVYARHNERRRKAYWLNPEAARAAARKRQRAHRRAHPELVRAKKRAQYWANVERSREKQRDKDRRRRGKSLVDKPASVGVAHVASVATVARVITAPRSVRRRDVRRARVEVAREKNSWLNGARQ